jgi:hypothetical protein
MMKSFKTPVRLGAVAALGCVMASPAVLASSHREAPFITEQPKVDGTDFYMFRSYETGQDDMVTLIANYQPLQDAYGGPSYFTMDPNALYEIHIDNNGDAQEDITFQFQFENTYRNAALPIGPDGADVTIPLVNVGKAGDTSDVGPGIDDNDGLNVVEDYTLTVVRGDRRAGTRQSASRSGGSKQFRKPVDNIGEKTIPNYSEYAENHVFDVTIPGCSGNSRVFVGQRAEGFVVNLGEVFDRINLNPLGDRNSASNILDDKNITSLALEVPASCLTASGDDADPVIGGWTTASLRQARVLNPTPQGPTNKSGQTGPAVEGGPWTQVSRLGSPLVNEVVIGLDAKDRFNASEPVNDLDPETGFGTFVLYPTLPALVTALFPDAVETPATPRNDLVAAFVTGIRTNVNGEPTNFTQPQAITDANADGLTQGGEMLRLNTAFPAETPTAENQNDLGFLACDLYGFPNGRRPIDDVVDIELSVAEGAVQALDPNADDPNPNSLQTCDLSTVPPTVVNDGNVVNDNAQPSADDYMAAFPYLNTPLPGSPNPDRPQ